MSANVDGMVREAINAYKVGKTEEAQTLLLRAVDLDDQNEMAWLWLSAVVEDIEDKKTCLENVLTINPNNEKARQGLRRLSEGGAAAAAPPPPSPPPAPPVDDEADEMPTSIEWDMPATESSSISSSRPVQEPSAAIYDDWVAGLNLGESQASNIFGGDEDDALSSSSPFTTEDFNFGYDQDELEDEAEDFTTEAPRAADEPRRAISSPMPSEAAEDLRFGLGVDYDDDEDDELDLTPARAAEPEGFAAPADYLSTTYFDGGQAADEYDEYDEDYDEASLQDTPLEEFFQFIPAEITATRLPGTHERYPALLVIGFIALLLLNAGALAWVVMTLITP